MPPFGFVGFAFFALEAWAMYHALCAMGVALPLPHLTPGLPPFDLTPDPSPSGRGGISRRRRAVVATLLAATFSVATVIGMERWTISSVVPRLADLPNLTPAGAELIEQAGISSTFELAKRAPATFASAVILPGVKPDSIIEVARLAAFRGIGAGHARELRATGVATVCVLGSQDPQDLWQRLHASSDGRKRPTPAEVRVWVTAAGRECVGS
jgi:hypothetical protein